MAEIEKLSWIPVRKGQIYCAPACGHRCTYAAYLKAKADAEHLAARAGEGWTTRVWENLGWHWSIRHEASQSQIHPNPRDTFFLLTENYDDFPQISADGDTLDECIQNARKKALRLAKWATLYAEVLK